MSSPMEMYLVVMAGGSGTRFWPKSTSKRPKQLLSFGGRKDSDADPAASLLQMTLSRFEGLVPPERTIIVTTRALAHDVKRQVPHGVTVLAEPQGRNTAPCVYWASKVVAERDSKGIIMVMPADHHIPDVDAFRHTLGEAAKWAMAHDDLVTLGVAPARPETGYGYLKMGDALGGECRKVEKFVEKPDLERAAEYVKSGQYLWNGGMFIWRAEVILKAFDRHMPEMRKTLETRKGMEDAYPEFPATSIDYGVMEKADNVVTFPLDCGWDDLGSWVSLENIAKLFGWECDAGVVTGGQCVAIESSGNIVDVKGKSLVALLGVDDLVIVDTGDTLMIAKKDRAQDIKKLVDAAKQVRPDLI